MGKGVALVFVSNSVSVIAIDHSMGVKVLFCDTRKKIVKVDVDAV